jgi:hypothetical protein
LIPLVTMIYSPKVWIGWLNSIKKRDGKALSADKALDEILSQLNDAR